MKYIKYLKYLFRHKWFVFLECSKRGLFWQGIKHDWTKFHPAEFFPYVEFFYGKDAKQVSRESRYQNIREAKRYFQLAWARHLARNKHHWQRWACIQDSGLIVCMTMPIKYIEEMVCDWIGAGRAQGYYNKEKPMQEVRNWYKKNGPKIMVNEKTRIVIEIILEKNK